MMVWRIPHNARVLIGLFIVATVVRLPGLYSRAIWYDETITMLETSGHARPLWPTTPTPASIAKKQFEGMPGLRQITEQLRQTDVHPPIYYWCLSLWRRYLGFSIEVARTFSLVCSVATILVFYMLLRVGHIQFPVIPAIVFGFSTLNVQMGHETRAYACALLFIILAALFAYLTVDAATRNKARDRGYALATGICCGAAFGTNYLALFPVIVILCWFCINFWPVARRLAILPALMTLLIGCLILTVASNQLGARSHQFAGYPGTFQQLEQLVTMNLSVFYTPVIPSKRAILVIWGIFTVCASLTVIQAINHWHRQDQKLLLLMLGLTLAPSAGIVLLNLAFNKHLNESRYATFAIPGIALWVSYGIAMLLSSQRRLGIFLLVTLLTLQLTGINWGLERMPYQSGSNMRSLAKLITASSSPSSIVVIGAGSGRGDPGTVIYEMAPTTMLVVLSNRSKIEQLRDQIVAYEEVWMIPAVDGVTSNIEKTFLSLLTREGTYTEVLRGETVVRLHRTKKETTFASASYNL